ncbi:hypothetical protein B7P43_G06195, partial [Cryptotermes secundus]
FGIPRNRAVPSAHAIKSLVHNFEDTGSTLKKKGGSAKATRTPENVAAVREAIERSPLHFYPYTIQITHALHEHNYENRVDFSDEAHFHLSGFVNKQNVRYWSATNPKEIYERPLRSSKVTVWSAISSCGITGPHFFADKWERAVTVTGPRVELLSSWNCSSSSQGRDVFCSKTGATCHTARASMAVVNSLFPNHVISRCGDIIWPAWSPDLSTCDFLLWGYLKSQVFKAPAPHTVQELKHRIREEVEQIPVEMLQRDLPSAYSGMVVICRVLFLGNRLLFPLS